MTEDNHKKKYFQFFIVVALVVGLDQISKALVLKHIPLHQSIKIIPGLFNLSHVHNPGGAFGFLAQSTSPLLHWVFLCAVVLALGLILYFFFTRRLHPIVGWVFRWP